MRKENISLYFDVGVVVKEGGRLGYMLHDASSLQQLRSSSSRH